MNVYEAVFSSMQEIRKRHGLTLDDICVESRRYGATWTPGFLSSMRHNKSATALPNMIILCKCLSNLTGEDVRLPDLFPGDGDIRIDTATTMSRAELRAALNGHAYSIDEASPVEAATAGIIADAIPDMMRQLSDRITSLANTTYGSRAAMHAPTLSESRAAKKLGITPAAAAAMCLLEYGDFLDDVTSSMAGDNASPQLRGRKTREITDRLDFLLEGMTESGRIPDRWLKTDNSTTVDDDPQWIADHLDQFDIAAKRGDTEAEQQAYEDLP